MHGPSCKLQNFSRQNPKFQNLEHPELDSGGFRPGLEKSQFFKIKKSDFFILNQIFYGLKIPIFAPRFYQILETGLSAQSRIINS